MNRPRTLVLVTTSFPIRGDGSEAAGSFVSDLAEELAKQVPVRVVAPGVRTEREEWAQGVEVFRFAAPEQPLSTLKPWKPNDLLAIRRVLVAGERATRQAAQSGPVSHILALWALPSGHWARRVSRAYGVPYSVWTLGSDIWTLGRIPLVRSYLRRVLRDAHACYSDGLKLAEDTRRIGEREVEFLPSTRRIERSRVASLKSAPPYRLLFLGRWHPNKGVDLLLDALKLLDASDWQRIDAVEIYGGGPLNATVHAGVDGLRAASRPAIVGGYLDKTAAQDAMLRADWMLIPSRIESIPVVFSDAVKLSLPVIASPVGDLPNLVARGVGHMAERVDPVAYARALSAALRQPPADMSADIANMAAEFAIESIAVRLLRGLGKDDVGSEDA